MSGRGVWQESSSSQSLTGDAHKRCAGVGIVIPSSIAAISILALAAVVTLDASKSFHRDGIATDSPVGWVAVLACIVLYGSFAIPLKAPAVVALGPSPMLFQMYVNVGVSVTLLVVTGMLLGTEAFAHISLWGLLGGLMYILANVGSTIGIRGLGFAVGIAIWGGTTIVVSFVWGACVLGQQMKSLVGSLGALLVLIVAIIGAGMSSQLQKHLLQSHSSPQAELELGMSQESSVREMRDLTSMGKAEQTSQVLHTSKIRGLVGMLVGACINGSLTMPYVYFAQAGKRSGIPSIELAYLVSFAIGVMLSTFVMALPFWIGKKSMHAQTLLMPGFLTGFYWASGNVCAIYATKYLGNTVGYPLCQCCVIVSGLIGIFYYKEMFLWKAISMFAVSVCLILVGSTMLASWATA